jgi:uncharacterized protein (TIGR03067 family)
MFALGFALLAVPALARGQEKAPEGDLAQLQGEWKGTVGPERNIPVLLTIKDKAISVKITAPDGQEYTMEGELKLDEKASPKAVDWVNFKTPAGEETQPNKGIYRLEKDKWVVCNGGPSNPRPTEFKQGEGGPPNVIELERVKK